MFSLSKLNSIFSINSTFNNILYKFKNKIILKILEKLVITKTNLLIYYLFIEIYYIGLLLINGSMIKDIKFIIIKKNKLYL